MDAGVSSSPNRITPSFEKGLQAIVGVQNIRPAAADDSIRGASPALVVQPGTEQALAQILQLANDAGLAVIPSGGATKLAWGNPPSRADLILSTARLNLVLEHPWADLTVTVEAGCTIKTLQETLAQHGQRLAFDPFWPTRATIGGVLSTNDSGALRLRFGALRDLIIGVTLALPNGALASSGGKVVKNVAGYDLPKLATGALGTLGVITRAVFRLHALPKQSRTLSCIAKNVEHAQALILAIQDSQLAHSALQARFIHGSPNPQLDILLESTQAGLTAQENKLRSLVSGAPVTESDPALWTTRNKLYSETQSQAANSAIAKVSCLPAQIAHTVRMFSSTAASHARCNVLFYANGIGTIHLEGEPAALMFLLTSFRSTLERNGGSLVVHHFPANASSLDAWGTPPDSFPLMRAVKHQFDPKSTLNPGRFVGGI